jgi:hypothetical protein
MAEETPQQGINLNKIIDGLNEMDHLSVGDRLQMFVTLIDPKTLIREVQTNAMLVQTGIQPASPCVAFAAGILRLGRPELFTQEEDDGQPSDGA